LSAFSGLCGETMRLILRAAVAAIFALASSVAFAPPGQAAVYAASGQRCTKVGTAGADTLTGTMQRDVLCGLGGSDTLVARGGNDIIDAGRGADVIDAGSGADLVFAGAGNDQADGGTGTDADRVHGGSGADDLDGGDGGDWVWGEAGPDHVGGGAGGDVIYGGTQNDWLTGGEGADDLWGQGENDDLVGGTGADDVNGGAGTNWCTVDAQDVQSRCVYDEQAPWVGALALSTPSVDVTTEAKLIGIKVRITDDTGVRSAQFLAYDDAGHALSIGAPSLVQGTIRDGWWKTLVRVPRWSDPAILDFHVVTRDRVGREAERRYLDAFQVINRTPDTQLPEVRLLRPAIGASVDVRESAQRVTIEARITDDVSGVSQGGSFCLWRPFEGGYTNLPCGLVDLVEGNQRSGIWRSHITVPQGSIGGDWNVGIWVTDNAHPAQNSHWMGPDIYRQMTDDGLNASPDDHLLPDGRGRISIIGAKDSTAAQIRSAEVTPTEVDTLPGSATVHIRVRATDVAGEKVTEVSAGLGHGTWIPGGIELPGADLQLTSGTRVDGIWEGDITLPQGVPPGTYYLSATVQDLTHWRNYVAASSPAASDPSNLILPGDPKVTVIENPAG
jgi:RTX calcium-binding nonapeptide repeat (4 copies)